MLYGPIITQPAIKNPKYKIIVQTIKRRIEGSDFLSVKTKI